MTRSVGVIIVVQRTETALVAVIERYISSTLLLFHENNHDFVSRLQSLRETLVVIVMGQKSIVLFFHCSGYSNFGHLFGMAMT